MELAVAGRSLSSAAAALVEVATGFHRRGWMLGTSGNLSVVLEREPLRLAITASGLDKGTLGLAQILPVDQDGRVLEGRPGKASDETALHLVLVRAAGAGSVLHTHSVWGTILSDAHAAAGGFAIEGYEML
ncbi:MAG TPA: class II aldolase/adducin family protein, partial [Vicinamibacteria bacterium]|nr:class II aldolase/adducin family protein [Vicinamibacteria bacterium]